MIASAEFAAYRAAVDASLAAHSQKYVDQTSATASLLVVWLHHLRSSLSNGTSDRLLDSSVSSLKECAGCLSVGLVRPALFAMRTQMELSIAWIYFNDHPIEWSHVEKYPDEFPLRGVNLKYLRTYNPRFEGRMTLLDKVRVRAVSDPYGLLSAHVHGTSAHAARAAADLSGVVRPGAELDEAITVLAAVSEYVTDVFASWFADAWHDWPEEAKDHISSRLSAPQLKAFCTTA